MTELTERESADRYCRYLAGRHYENFSVASLLVPSAQRLHLARIYAYCRTTDDFGDESRGDAEARLRSWRLQVEALFAGRADPVHPVLLALQSTIDEFGLPSDPFVDLIDANLQDQRVSEYADWAALRGYCMLSAAPVGRLVLGVFGVVDSRAVALSDDVCIGLQLANFAQDVGVDRRKGRTYLIGRELHDHGLQGAVRLLCDRAESLLQSGRELETMVSGRLRVQLSLYRLGGGAIIAAIRRAGYATDQARPVVSRVEKIRLLGVALRETARRYDRVPARPTANRNS